MPDTAASELPLQTTAEGGEKTKRHKPELPPVSRRAGWWRSGDRWAGLVYALGALWVTARGWINHDGRFLGSHPGDQSFNEWMLANAAHAVTHLQNPFFSSLQNAPDGVNLATNIGLQLPGIVLTPVTLVAGAPLSYTLLITVNSAATAFAWYWVLSRHIVASRAAAFVGGLFIGFSPAMVSHSNGHPHITAQFVLPFILWRVVRLTEPGHIVRNGVILGGLVTLQFYLSVEVLLLVAVGCAIAALCYVALRFRAALRAALGALASLGVAAVMTLVLTAYPLWMMFLGPQSRIGQPGAPEAHVLKLGALVAYAAQSLGGGPGATKGLTANTAEEASFFGWPVLILALTAVTLLRRSVGVWIVCVTAVVATVLAMGTTLTWGSERTSIPAPFALLQDVPPFDAVVVARFGLITTVALGILFALATDRVAAEPGAPVRLIGAGAFASALLPVLPMPLPATDRPAVPALITSGEWRKYVGQGRTLVPVPVDNMRSIRWGAAADVGFAVPQGYFLGPTSPTDRTGRWGVTARPTAALLTAVAEGRRTPAVKAAERAQAEADVRHWRADAVVLHAVERRAAQLRAALEGLYGPGQRVGDVWLWDVRGFTEST